MNIKTLKYLLRHPFGDGDYGFIAAEAMPTKKYISYDIPNMCTDWAVTGDFARMAKNHCAAVAVMNLALYFAENGRPELKKATYKDTFAAVHHIIGNGPVFGITRGAEKYFRGCGCALRARPFSGIDGLRAAVSGGHPCALLLADGLFQWHWVLAVGYREYAAGETYLRLVTGWHRRADRFYKPDSGSVVLSAAELWTAGNG